MEKNVKRFPASVDPETVEGVVVSNLLPAEPARMRSTKVDGIQAYLILLAVLYDLR